MVTTQMGRRSAGSREYRSLATGPVPPDPPAGPAAAPWHGTAHTLRSESMVAVPLEPGEWVDTGWVERMRGPYTSRARHLLERAITPPSGGRPPADHHGSDRVPTWARAVATGHRGLLDALGLDLPRSADARSPVEGPLLVQHLVPAITLGWYLVTTLHATEHAVVLVEGTYAEHRSSEAPYPVRWS